MTKRLNLGDLPKDAVTFTQNGIILITKVKNEIKRLEFFLHYYRIIGVTDFIFIDNNSTDGTVDFLLNQDSVTVVSTEESLVNHDEWIQKVLNTYCVDKWVIVVDADELLYFPYIEKNKISIITKYSDSKGSNAVIALLLDMYSSEPLSAVSIKNSYSPLLKLNFFDKNTHYLKHTRYYGGVRKRVFGLEPCLTKIPLFRFSPEMVIAPGMHSLKNATYLNLSLTLLHCKFDNEFNARVVQAVKEGVYWDNSREYKQYVGTKHPVFYDSEVSAHFSGSHDLIGKAVMVTAYDFDKYLLDQKLPKVSVIICTYGKKNISHDLTESLKNQTLKGFEVLIVDNNATAQVDDGVYPEYRVVHEARQGLSFARNTGIENVLGEYVVFLDDDVILDQFCLKKMLDGAQSFESDIVGASVRLRSDINKKLTKRERRFLSELIYPNNIEFINAPKYIVGACMMMKRTVFIRYGLFLTTLGRMGKSLLSGEETEFIKRVTLYGGKISYICDAFCTHNIDLKRVTLRYLIRRAFWQGVTEYKIDEIFDTKIHRKYKIVEYNSHDFLLNCSRIIGYKLAKYS